MSVDAESPTGELSEFETQFVPQSNDDNVLWEVVEIVAERGKKYRVRWAGNDPKTRRPWPLDWVPKHDCTDHLVEEWKRKNAEKRRSKKAANSKATLPNAIKGLYDFHLPKDALCSRRKRINRRRGTPTGSALDLKTTELEA
ncbi:hypothetical protein K503DRAFT_293538 [Rhizopogon vinicolor AM-OR11-026]|uniref:Chromo domain-containing protein n=1 Tax=Rhizopogon vinicolor AM-OR11-026 TaxID=1314800 RepID=A0A1B7ND10_9AGAM|nr:hypothetical protein K503DRAFT_293538 [Rhizopogon vinicolor AM-OR11-026]